MEGCPEIPTFSIRAGFLDSRFEILYFIRQKKEKIIFFFYLIYIPICFRNCLKKKKSSGFVLKSVPLSIFSCKHQCNYEICVCLLHLSVSYGF